MTDDPTLGAKAERRSLVPRLIEAGPRAPFVLAEVAVEALGAPAAQYAAGVRSPGGDVAALVERVITAHRNPARLEGVTAGAAVSFAEMTTVIGTAGTLTVPAAAVTLTGDIVSPAWIQVRMVLIIAALHGHDPQDAARARELLTFTGVYGAGPAAAASGAASRGTQRVGKRLLMRYLRGDALKNLTQLFRFVGVNFTRAGLLRGMPLVNMPVNDRATKALGSRAADYYRMLPAPAGS